MRPPHSQLCYTHTPTPTHPLSAARWGHLTHRHVTPTHPSSATWRGHLTGMLHSHTLTHTPSECCLTGPPHSQVCYTHTPSPSHLLVWVLPDEATSITGMLHPHTLTLTPVSVSATWWGHLYHRYGTPTHPHPHPHTLWVLPDEATSLTGM